MAREHQETFTLLPAVGYVEEVRYQRINDKRYYKHPFKYEPEWIPAMDSFGNKCIIIRGSGEDLWGDL